MSNSCIVETNPYCKFIYKSRYARWDYDQNRREDWHESVKRLCDFWKNRCEFFPYEEIYNAIYEGKVMPSMRSLMTAGKALDKDNVAGYNCAFLAIDDPKAFDEVLYILSCGTGVGFSVERQSVQKLPVIAEEFFDTDTIIVVPDSKIGWATSLRELISLLYAGKVPSWDTHKVRPAGAILKTFGGRASGPGPLEDIFNFAVRLFKNAAGRKLTSLECHDLVCKIAESIVTGGVRRSALISLSNLSDDRMRDSKSGAWWETNTQRALANNSAVYTEKPEMGLFIKEWKALYDSKSGERGIFNRKAADIKSQNGRRNTEGVELGTNPCLVADTWVETSFGPKQVKDLVGNSFIARINDTDKPSTDGGFWFTGVKDVYEITTVGGYKVRATADHRFFDGTGWVEVQEMTPGDTLQLDTSYTNEWSGEGTEDLGWLLGEIVGDGGYNEDKTYAPYLRFWGESQIEMQDLAVNIIRRHFNPRSDFTGNYSSTHDSRTVLTPELYPLCRSYLEPGTKEFKPELESNTSSAFIKGFLRGLFDADGTVAPGLEKGCSVRLPQNSVRKLEAVQRMLLRFGIFSTLYKNRKPEGMYPMPNGHGFNSDYFCKAMHELVISNQSVERFTEIIGFNEPAKNERLAEIRLSRKRVPNKDKTLTVISEIRYCGQEAVFDCTIPDGHAFIANGIVSHNCAEILLRSCEFCNLSEVVIRAEDTLETLAEKVRIATIIGTHQSTLTDFRYLRAIWRKNCEEERLLGVSLTGCLDHPVLSHATEEAHSWLRQLRDIAIETNKEWAEILGVPVSVAITCNKPSGTVSQLMLCGSGIHGWYDRYFIRTVRANKSDPLALMMKDSGVPCEDDVMNPDRAFVFSFPIEAPKDSRLASEINALEQLEIWKMYRDSWCEHNPSATIYVRDDEWMEVGAWVYKHFDEIGGLSFLPFSDHVYKQAPYQPCSETTFNDARTSMPLIPWESLNKYEVEDYTTGNRELACSAGQCSI